MSLQKIANLETLLVAGEKNAPTIILFHGYGANAHDLFGLHQAFQLPRALNWVFPNAPIDLGMQSRAWFHIDTAALEAAMATGSHRDLTNANPDGLAESEGLAKKFIAALGLNPAKTIIGGFSQGAMLATEITLLSQENFAALCILSGTLLKQQTWRQLANNKAGLPFFQSHGRYDPLLSFSDAEKLYNLLNEAGLSGEFLPFDGMHEIPMNVIAALNKFLLSREATL